MHHDQEAHWTINKALQYLDELDRFRGDKKKALDALQRAAIDKQIKFTGFRCKVAGREPREIARTREYMTELDWIDLAILPGSLECVAVDAREIRNRRQTISRFPAISKVLDEFYKENELISGWCRLGVYSADLRKAFPKPLTPLVQDNLDRLVAIFLAPLHASPSQNVSRPNEEAPYDLSTAVAEELKRGIPGKNVIWKVFCHNVRSRCGKDKKDRGFGDKTIERLVKRESNKSMTINV